VPLPAPLAKPVSTIVTLAIAAWLCAVTACGAGPQVQVTPTGAPVDAKGLASRPQAGRPGAAPTARPGSLDPVQLRRDAAARARKNQSKTGVPGVSAATRQRLAPFAAALKNAARRDRAMERTMRMYMLITREVFRHLRSSGSGANGSRAASYDPVPAWRFQARVGRDFMVLSDRAGMIELHLADMAAADQRSSAATSPSRRGERLALFRNVFTCIRGDAWRRAAHGAAWAKRSPADVEAGFSETARIRLYRQELQMMRMSVRCSTLIASRRARN